MVVDLAATHSTRRAGNCLGAGGRDLIAQIMATREGHAVGELMVIGTRRARPQAIFQGCSGTHVVATSSILWEWRRSMAALISAPVRIASAVMYSHRMRTATPANAP